MIRPIASNDIEIFRDQAEKSGLVFCNSARLYGYFIDNNLVAFCGMIIYKNKAIFKNSFVHQDYRGKGYFKMLFNYRMHLAKSFGLKKVEATCTDMSINHFLKNNFKVIKEYKKFKKVCNENI
jgi:GNAT superfamily N-acetyltransferase